MITFDGPKIDLWSLKHKILEQENYDTRSNDLKVTDSNTLKTYRQDSEFISKNANVLIIRVPLAQRSGRNNRNNNLPNKGNSGEVIIVDRGAEQEVDSISENDNQLQVPASNSRNGSKPHSRSGTPLSMESDFNKTDKFGNPLFGNAAHVQLSADEILHKFGSTLQAMKGMGLKPDIIAKPKIISRPTTPTDATPETNSLLPLTQESIIQELARQKEARQLFESQTSSQSSSQVGSQSDTEILGGISNDGDYGKNNGGELVRNHKNSESSQNSNFEGAVELENTKNGCDNNLQHMIQQNSVDSESEFAQSSPVLLNPDQNSLESTTIENEDGSDSDSRDEDDKIRQMMINSNWYKVSISMPLKPSVSSPLGGPGAPIGAPSTPVNQLQALGGNLVSETGKTASEGPKIVNSVPSFQNSGQNSLQNPNSSGINSMHNPGNLGPNQILKYENNKPYQNDRNKRRGGNRDDNQNEQLSQAVQKEQRQEDLRISQFGSNHYNRPQIRAATGIPLSKMVPCKETDKGAMVIGYNPDGSGMFMTTEINLRGYAKKKIEKIPFLHDANFEAKAVEPSIPKNLICPLTKELIDHAMRMTCCDTSFSAEMLSASIMALEGKCPKCRTEATPADARPDEELRGVSRIVEFLL